MYGYDPIYLEKKNIYEWLLESDDNILLFINTHIYPFIFIKKNL